MQIKHHLAIPCRSVSEAMQFYSKLGCKIGRHNEKMCIVDFFGCQLVCHLDPEKCDKANVKMYPRHFGIILDKDSWFYLEKFCKRTGFEFYQETIIRNDQKNEEHTTFFLKDPSNNLIEFKTYVHERVI